MLPGKRDSSQLRSMYSKREPGIEVGLIKIYARDAGYFQFSVGNLGNHDDSTTRSSGKCDSSRREQLFLLSTKQTMH